MPGFLRQSTAGQSRSLGPFISDTDFKTVQTGLTIANTDIKLIVNGGASANKNSGGGTHRANGVYGVTFDATDTATVGEMEVSVLVSGAMVVFDKFFVIEEAVYDAWFAASAPGYVTDQPVNATKIGGTTQTARDIGASVLLSSGTGTGQLDFTSGVVKANVTQFGGSNGTFASGIPAVNASQFGGAAVTATTSVTIPAASTLATTTGAVGSVTGAVGSVTGNVGGNVTGSVGSVVGAVGSVTGNVGGSVGSVVADVTADVVKIDGVADAADRLQKVVQGNVFGTVGVGSTTTSIVTSALDPAAAVNDQYKGRILTFKNDTTTANLRGQSTDITASTSLGVLTVTALTTSPASGDTFTIS